ncbi:MAG: hypothetical protein WCC11_05220 [Gammaproteobacteria bacterium]
MIVIALGILYYLSIFYLIGFVARHVRNDPVWIDKLAARHLLWIWFTAHEFLYYIVPALVVAFLTSLFRPGRWLIYSLLLVGPMAIYSAVMYWIRVVPVHFAIAFEGSAWRSVVFILGTVLLYGLPPFLLWLAYKVGPHFSRKPQPRTRQPAA